MKTKITNKQVRKFGESIYLLNLKYGLFEIKNYLKFLVRNKFNREELLAFNKALKLSKSLYLNYVKGREPRCRSLEPISAMERDYRYYLCSTTLLRDLKKQGLQLKDLEEERLLVDLYHNFEKGGEKDLQTKGEKQAL